MSWRSRLRDSTSWVMLRSIDASIGTRMRHKPCSTHLPLRERLSRSSLTQSELVPLNKSIASYKILAESSKMTIQRLGVFFVASSRSTNKAKSHVLELWCPGLINLRRQLDSHKWKMKVSWRYASTNYGTRPSKT